MCSPDTVTIPPVPHCLSHLIALIPWGHSTGPQSLTLYRKMHYRIRSDTLGSLKMQFYQNHLSFRRSMIFSTTYCTLSKGVLLFLMKGSPFSNMQTCHGLYWRKLSTYVLKVFVIKSNVEPFLQSAVFQDVTCVSLFWSVSGFPHLSPAAFHLSALPYSLSSFASKISCNCYLASQFSSWWQLPPSPSVLRKS